MKAVLHCLSVLFSKARRAELAAALELRETADKVRALTGATDTAVLEVVASKVNRGEARDLLDAVHQLADAVRRDDWQARLALHLSGHPGSMTVKLHTGPPIRFVNPPAPEGLVWKSVATPSATIRFPPDLDKETARGATAGPDPDE